MKKTIQLFFMLHVAFVSLSIDAKGARQQRVPLNGVLEHQNMQIDRLRTRLQNNVQALVGIRFDNGEIHWVIISRAPLAVGQVNQQNPV